MPLVVLFSFYLSPYWQKYCSFIPAGFVCPHTDKHLAVLFKRTFDTQSIHIFRLVYYLSTSRNSPYYIRCYTYGKRSFVKNVLSYMFTNGNIVVCKYIIWFYSNLYFCQTHIWTSLLFIYISGVTHMENDLLFCSILKLMFTNGKIIIYKFMIQFYSYLYFCQSYSWNKGYLINYSQ